jgi:hypothetical protein
MKGRIPPPTPTNGTSDALQPVDLGAKQQAIMEQVASDEAILARLQANVAAITARLQASRGKLELIAELSEEAQRPVVTSSDDPT